MRSDGLSFFAGVIDAGCAHSHIVVGKRKPREMPQFTWVNSVLGNLKTMINCAHRSFRFSEYTEHNLGAVAYRFNGRFDLQTLLRTLIGDTATASPMWERQIRRGAQLHD